MKTAAVICEFNPLHNGHARLLSLAKEDADAVVCIMSGSVVQRGETALLDKYTRAVHAVEAGADLVIELPAEYTLSGAPQFAAGAVAIANLLGGETTLLFGSECGDVAVLEDAIALLASKKVNAETARLMSGGANYPTALSAAAKTCASTDAERVAANALACPNNVLGLEYIKAIIDTGRKIHYKTTIRPDYDAITAPTSSEVRSAAFAKVDVSASVPPFVAASVGEYASTFDKRDDALFALVRFLVPHMPDGICDDSEGLSDRLRSAAKRSSSMSEYLSAAKVKRYPMARIKRLTLNALLGNNLNRAALLSPHIGFVNILAARKDKADMLLGAIGADVCVTRRDLAPHRDAFAVTERADELFEAVCYPFVKNARFV